MAYAATLQDSAAFIVEEYYHCRLQHIDELVQERRNSIANACELRFSCTNPSI